MFAIHFSNLHGQFGNQGMIKFENDSTHNLIYLLPSGDINRCKLLPPGVTQYANVSYTNLTGYLYIFLAQQFDTNLSNAADVCDHAFNYDDIQHLYREFINVGPSTPNITIIYPKDIAEHLIEDGKISNPDELENFVNSIKLAPQKPS
jgi:hypothetical protein